MSPQPKNPKSHLLPFQSTKYSIDPLLYIYSEFSYIAHNRPSISAHPEAYTPWQNMKSNLKTFTLILFIKG